MKVFCSKCAKSITVEPGTSPTVKCPDCSTEIPRPESDLSPGAVIGDFIIEKSLSKGGMGEVFLAKQISLDRPVALKILQKEFTNDRDYVASLFREARAAARINHPNVIQAYAVGNEGDNYYFAMELVRGDTLKNILRKEGALAPERAAKIILEISNAIGVAWRDQKLVHQDIKPDNIMLDVNGFSKLADLGLAKTGSIEQRIDDDSDEVLGTPQYISPEQLTGVPTDVRSDIYSLGATFYHIITGKLPYRASDVNQLAQMHNEGRLTPPKEVNADIPEELNRIIVKMMARDIQSRYQTPEELSADLKEFLEGNHEAAAKSGVKKLTAPKLVIPGKAKEGALKVSLPKSAPAADNKDADIELSAPKPAVPKPVVPPTAIPPAAPKAAVPQPAVPRPVVPPAAPKAACLFQSNIQNSNSTSCIILFMIVDHLGIIHLVNMVT